MKTNWTVETVKEELPDVIVFVQNTSEQVFCRTAGRLNDFATVYNPQTGQQWQYCWTTIVRCLNLGHNLLA